MSWVIEEITTSTISFVIAMVIIGTIIGGALYGYWIYANHVTLENYLWPIAEVLPYQGEYFLGIVNTGHEPFYVEQIYLKGGTVITPSQAGNPNLNWCSVSNTELVHNQWWCGEVNQLPVAVRVCSTLDPQVCSIVPVHGWQVVTFSQPSGAGNGSGSIEVVVDPYNAGWTVSWSYSGQSYSVGESGSYSWFINPPYIPIQLSFTASITNNPSGYTCQIQPSSITKTYNAGSVQTFTVTCSPAVYLTVVYTYNIWNPYPTYTIYYSGGATGSISGPPNEPGPGTHTYNYVIATNGPITLTTAINNPDPSHITCSVSPQSTTANPGQSVTIYINCNYNFNNNNNNNNNNAWLSYYYFWFGSAYNTNTNTTTNPPNQPPQQPPQQPPYQPPNQPPHQQQQQQQNTSIVSNNNGASGTCNSFSPTLSYCPAPSTPYGQAYLSYWESLINSNTFSG